MNLRCVSDRRALWPIDRFLRGLRALRPVHPERLFVGALVGVPGDLVHDPDAIDYEGILADPRMQVTTTEGPGGSLEASCRSAGGGAAYPPRRIVKLLRSLAPASVAQSICADNFDGTVEALVAGLGRTIRQAACTETGR